jgi:transglutaminase-like putative cysteine protease
MDFSAWFEVYLDNRWWAFDARNNQPRLGRILMATGRDASDVAMTTSFGQADLWSFFVVSEEEAGAAPEQQASDAQDSITSRSTPTLRV